MAANITRKTKAVWATGLEKERKQEEKLHSLQTQEDEGGKYSFS